MEALRNGDPRIEVSGGDETLNVAVIMLEPEHVDIGGARIKDVLGQAIAAPAL